MDYNKVNNIIENTLRIGGMVLTVYCIWKMGEKFDMYALGAMTGCFLASDALRINITKK